MQLTLRLNTKEMLATSLQELLREKPLRTIQVKDITQKCGASRTTFYKHFHDKYDLMNWIYKHNVDKLLASSNNWQEKMYQISLFIWNNRSFFSKIIQYREQNSLIDYIVEYATAYCLGEISKKTDIITEDMAFAINQYIAGISYMIRYWIAEGFRDSPEEFSKKICDNIPEQIRLLFESV